MNEALRNDLADEPTSVHFIDLSVDAEQVLRKMREAAVDISSDYVSIQLLTASFDNAEIARKVFEQLPRGDLAKIDLPVGDEFSPERAEYLIDVIRRSDYKEQADVSERFFRLLRSQRPYRVEVRTRSGELVIDDDSGCSSWQGPLPRVRCDWCLVAKSRTWEVRSAGRSPSTVRFWPPRSARRQPRRPPPLPGSAPGSPRTR
jgi:hypothetical protein